MKTRATILLGIVICVLIFVTYRFGLEKSLVDFKDAALKSLPKILTASLIVVLGQIVVRLIKPTLSKILGRLDQRQAIMAIIGLVIHVVAILAALSVVVGSVSYFITSLGLIGLGITWALQTPILCFTGWILINLRGYYRVGDRIKVNDIYGDVFQIDFLTTTIWENGSTWFTSEQPSGRLITIPNSLLLQTAIYNYTRDFPFVWDEVSVSMSYESDFNFTRDEVLQAARDILGESMVEPARQYREILKRANLDHNVSDAPEIYLTFADSWVSLHLRYLVSARGKRKVRSRILEGIFRSFSKPENVGRIKPVYPRIQSQRIGLKGMPIEEE
jgi:small-conductance mechanosensitive channel